MLSWGLLLSCRVFGAVQVMQVGVGELACCLCTPALLGTLALFLRLSGGCRRAWLVEHGGYELGTNFLRRQLLWYLFILGSQLRYLVLTFSQPAVQSLEVLYRNARWLERESGEMHDIWFSQKRDRRALFLVPLLYWGPLRRAFPVSGFFDLRLTVGSGKLQAYHVTWLD
jgi:hypothetical protein